MGRPQESQTLAGEAYLIVRERILKGDFAIGQCISRRKLAAELGMSFLPVTEALLRLENEGLLESRPRAGTRVRIPTREDIEGHYVVREALEVKSAMLFAEVATAAERAELQKLAVRVDSLSVQTTAANRSFYLTLHERLHWRIAECTKSKILCDVLKQTSALASTWLCVEGFNPSDITPRTHQDLLEILSNGNPHDAGEAMRRHIQSRRDKTMRSLQVYFQMRGKYADAYSRSSRSQVTIESMVADSLAGEQVAV